MITKNNVNVSCSLPFYCAQLFFVTCKKLKSDDFVNIRAKQVFFVELRNNKRSASQSR